MKAAVRICLIYYYVRGTFNLEIIKRRNFRTLTIFYQDYTFRRKKIWVWEGFQGYGALYSIHPSLPIDRHILNYYQGWGGQRNWENRGEGGQGGRGGGGGGGGGYRGNREGGGGGYRGNRDGGGRGGRDGNYGGREGGGNFKSRNEGNFGGFKVKYNNNLYFLISFT